MSSSSPGGASALRVVLSSPHPSTSAWRRILYEPQPFPDNYTPPTFLSQYLTPSTASTSPSPSLPYWSLVFLSLIVACRLCVLELFLCLFHLVTARGMRAQTLLLVDCALIVALLFLHLLFPPSSPSPSPLSSSSSSSSSRSSLPLLVLVLFLVSPLLSSLTSSYSDDTIHLLTALLSLLHLLSCDYRPSSQHPSLHPPLDHTLSLNAALFLSVLLASRLSSPALTFLLLLASALLFGVSPGCGEGVRGRGGEGWHGVWCGSVVGVTTGVVGWVDWRVMLVHGVVLCGVVLACPWWMLRGEGYKREWKGPWDYDDEPENRAENL